MIHKLKQILQGWIAVVYNHPDNERIAKVRREICNSCDENTKGFIPTCDLCGCVLAAKTRALYDDCDLNKWPASE